MSNSEKKPTVTVEQARQILEEDRQKRLQNTEAELNGVLAKYGTYLDYTVRLHPVTGKTEIDVEIKTKE